MNLLVVIIEDPNKIEPLLDRWYEHDIAGATILDSRGMGHIISEHYSIFSRFSDLTGTSSESPNNNLIFTVIETEKTLQDAIQDVRDIIGDLSKPNTGMLFSLPVNNVEGFNTPIQDEERF